MSVTKRQFDLLQAMGITVWQRRDLPAHVSQSTQINVTAHADTSSEIIENNNENQQVTAASEASVQVSPVSEAVSIDLSVLLKQQLFRDVIQCLGVSRADISIQSDQIDLGLINWQFNQNKRIEFSHNCLKTPDLNTIANSVELKKALWQSLGPLSST
jgi:DNA polymerase III psi subunit